MNITVEKISKADLVEMLSEGVVSALVPTLLMLAVAGILLVIAARVKKKWKKSFREPFDCGILRPPGWGCLERREDALLNLSMLVMATSLLWAWLGYVATGGRDVELIGFSIVILPFTIWAVLRIAKDMRRARTARLGFLGECLVAEHLAPLEAEGWKVFHDVEMEKEGKRFNIDHVAVGAGGVFAVETKTLSRLMEKHRGDWKATVDGDTVLLPGNRRSYPLKQAKRQAASLRDFLNEQGVEIGFVAPLVALAGWQVSWKKGGNRAICDARNIAGQLRKREKILQAGEVERIVEVLDEKCRVLRFSEEQVN